MSATKEYWQNKLPHPLSPNDSDVKLYLSLITDGTALLLGCTHDLIKYTTNQMDIDPWYQNQTVITMDWQNNEDFYDNMIGDGSFNLSKELTDNVLKMASKCTKNLVIRCFNQKLPEMRVANYFPTKDDFEIKPSLTIKFKDYSFYVWEF